MIPGFYGAQTGGYPKATGRRTSSAFENVRKRGVEISRNNGHARESTQAALRPLMRRHKWHELGDGSAGLRDDNLLAGFRVVNKPGKMRLGIVNIEGLHGLLQ